MRHNTFMPRGQFRPILRATAGFPVPYRSLERRGMLSSWTLVQHTGHQGGGDLSLFRWRGVRQDCKGTHLPTTRLGWERITP